MTVNNMLSSMSQTELIYWISYFKIENEEYENNKSTTSNNRVDENGYKIVTQEEQQANDNALAAQLKKMAGLS